MPAMNTKREKVEKKKKGVFFGHTEKDSLFREKIGVIEERRMEELHFLHMAKPQKAF